MPRPVLAQIHRGEIETASLAELLRCDLGAILKSVCPDIPRSAPTDVNQAGGVVARMARAAALMLQHQGPGAIALAAAHRSDVVRGWAAYMLAQTPGLTLAQRLEWARPLADDPNSGVREWAWIALRPALAVQLPEGISLLVPWTRDPSPNIRRFASEITRPRGVWCAHIPQLKADPAPGLPILEPLRSDPTKYVQDSVSNWLNDASKGAEPWVRALCKRWAKESPSPQTARICKRALRSVDG